MGPEPAGRNEEGLFGGGGWGPQASLPFHRTTGRATHAVTQGPLMIQTARGLGPWPKGKDRFWSSVHCRRQRAMVSCSFYKEKWPPRCLVSSFSRPQTQSDLITISNSPSG